MDIQHIFFKRKSRLVQFLFSFIAVVTILSLLSTVVYAADDTDRVGITTVNGGGASGNTYGKGDGSWAIVTQGQSQFGFMGYRVYVVDATGNLKSQVVDLTYQNPSSVSTKQTYDTLVCGKVATVVPRTIIATRDHTQVLTTNGAGQPYVYQAAYYGKDNNGNYKVGGGNYVLGERFASWMMLEDNNGDKNAEKLMQYAFGKDSTGQYIAETYLKNADWRLIVEPLMYSDIWTSNLQITVEKSYVTEEYREHYLSFGGEVYDFCCTASKTDGGTGITREEFKQYCISNGRISYMYNNLIYGIGKLDDSFFAHVHQAYDDCVDEAEKYERLSAEALGYGSTDYKDLATVEQKVAVYNYMMQHHRYYLNPETTYIKSATVDGYKYLPTNPVDSGNGKYVYGDYSIAYPNSGWKETVVNGKLKHYVSAYTGVQLYSSYTGIKNYLKDVVNLTGSKGSTGGVCADYINPVGSGFNLTANEKLGEKTLPQGTPGIHIYLLAELGGNPIHTKDRDDGTPHPAEEPKEENKNTGDCTIIKVYGNVYKDESGKIYYIEDKTTEVRTGTTDSIIIEQESPYELVEWRVGKTVVTYLTASQWKSVSSTNTLVNKVLPFTSYVIKTPTSVGFIPEDGKPYKMEEEDGKVLYLLYLKTINPLETSDLKVPSPPTQFTPNNPTYPEVPTGDKKKDPNGYNIIKVYALLDQYNGAPISYERYIQTQTIPFIKIESESNSNWTLAHWYTTNHHNPEVTASNFLQPIDPTNQSQVNTLLEQGYNLLPNPTSVGTIFTHGSNPTTKYFKDNSKTVYLIFTRINGNNGNNPNYEAGTYYIPESFLSKSFTTAGQAITITTQTGTLTEEFCKHLFTVLNPAFNTSAPYTDKTITARITATLASHSSIFQDSTRFIKF